MATPFQYVSLFSGCGGFDVGFSQAGFKCVGAIDIDKKALSVLESNLGGPVYNFDLSTGELPNTLPKSVDVVLAGSPCQGFSTLGKRKIDDPRNALLLAGGRAAIKLRAKVFVAENVLAVRSGAHRKYWEELKEVLANGGYKLEESIIDSRNVGIAQSRRRVFLIAWKDREFSGLVQPALPKTTLRQALENVAGLPNHHPTWLVEKSPESIISNRILPGHKLSNVRSGSKSIHTWNIPEVFGDVSEEEKSILDEIIGIRRRLRVRDNGDADPLPFNYAIEKFGSHHINRLLESGYLKFIGGDKKFIDLANGFNGKFRRPEWDSHSITVDTKFCNPKYYLHPGENRGFSTREAARIQGFPDDFIFGNNNHDATLIGNAVAPPVARYIANYIMENLLDGTQRA
jgi:DNA (cytosine-5)-methyltransferase 1